MQCTSRMFCLVLTKVTCFPTPLQRKINAFLCVQAGCTRQKTSSAIWIKEQSSWKSSDLSENKKYDLFSDELSDVPCDTSSNGTYKQGWSKKEYCSKDPFLEIQIFDKLMNPKRFEQIWWCLHFNNELQPQSKCSPY
jgi:hypothetical protein